MNLLLFYLYVLYREEVWTWNDEQERQIKRMLHEVEGLRENQPQSNAQQQPKGILTHSMSEAVELPNWSCVNSNLLYWSQVHV